MGVIYSPSGKPIRRITGTDLVLSALAVPTPLAITGELTGAPSSGAVGAAATGVSFTLANTTSATVGFFSGGTLVGTAVTVTGASGSVSGLVFPGAGSYTLQLRSGGTVLWTSGTVTVSAAQAATPAGALVGAPTTGTTGAAVTGLSVTLTNASSGTVQFYNAANVPQGLSVTVTGGAVAGLTYPPSAGAYTLKLVSGGTLLHTSDTVTVSAPAQAGGSAVIWPHPGTAFPTGLRPNVQLGVLQPAFFVSPAGNDNNPGSLAQPFATLAKAQLAMRGSTKRTYIRGGVHALTQAIEHDTRDNGVTWLAYPGETPIIDGGGNGITPGSGLVSPFRIMYGVTGVTIRWLTIRNCAVSGIEMHGGTGLPTSGCWIADNEIYNVTIPNLTAGCGNAGGVWGVFRAVNNLIENNYIHDVQCPGITLVAGTTDESISGNVIRRNRCVRLNNSGQKDSGGIYLLDRGHAQSGCVIDGNWVEDWDALHDFGGGPGQNCRDCKGIYLDDQTSGVIVCRNVVTGKGSWGFQIHGGDNNTVVGNIFDISHAMELCLYQEDVVFGYNGMANNIFRNNIVFSTIALTGNVGEPRQPGVWTTILDGPPQQAKPIVSDNIYCNTASPFPLTGNVDVIDTNALVVNPNFTNVAAKDYSFADGGAAVAAIGFEPINPAYIGPATVVYAAPSAVLTLTSNTSSVGGAVSGTVVLTGIETAYAVISHGGVEEGARLAFTGTSLPATLHPAQSGTSTVQLWTEQTGGTKLDEKGPLTVSGPVPQATLSGVSTSANRNGSISGTVTLSYMTTAYVCLAKAGVQEGARVATSGGLVSLSPQTAASTYAMQVWDVQTGGNKLDEKGPINVVEPGTTVSPAFFVSPTGSDTGVGNELAPFKSMEKARAMMGASGTTKDTYLRGGTHGRTARFEMGGLGNLDTGTSYRRYPGETPIIDGGGTVGHDVQQSWGAQRSAGWFVDYHAKGILIDGLTFANFFRSAILLNGFDDGAGDDGTITDVVIQNCTLKNITGGGEYGCGNWGAIRGSFATRNCTIQNNTIMDTYGPSVAFVAGAGTNERVQGIKILRNRCLRSNNTGLDDTGGIYFLDRSHSAPVNNPHIIDGNYVNDVGAAGYSKHIYLDDEASCFVIRNNILSGQGHYLMQWHGSDNVDCYNNILDASEPSHPADQFMVMYQEAVSVGFPNYGMSNNKFYKNILFTSHAWSQNQMWQFLSGGYSIAKPTVSNNIYFSTLATLPVNNGDIIDAAPSTVNPKLTNPTGRDYSFTDGGTVAASIGFTPINMALIGPQG